VSDQFHQSHQSSVAFEALATPSDPTIQPTDPGAPTPTKPKIKCDNIDCSRWTFGRPTDLVRHINSVHGGEETYLWCPAPNCDRNKVYGQRPYSKARKDKLREHIRRIHISDDERRLWPIWFRQVDDAART